MASVRPLAPVALAAVVAITGCSGGGAEPAAAPSTLTTTTADDNRIELAQSCVHEQRDVRVDVRYPKGWDVNDHDVQPCSAFDPEPFDLRPGTEFPRDLAVLLYVEPLDFDRLTADAGLRVERERRMTIDGRRAVRQVVSAVEPWPSPRTTSTRYVVDGGAERTIIATTFHVDGNDFQRSAEILDAMVESFQIEPRNP